jgi:hypothetical protein
LKGLEMSKGVLRGYVEANLNVSNKKQYLIDCILEERDFVHSFKVYGEYHRSFKKEIEELNKLLNCNFTDKQLYDIVVVIGCLSSSIIPSIINYELDKNIGDMIVDGLHRGIGRISCNKDEKYEILSKISNYSKEELLKKLEKVDDKLIFVSSLIDKVVGEKKVYINFKRIHSNSVSFGYEMINEAKSTIEVTPLKDDLFRVVYEKRYFPVDKYGRKMYHKAVTFVDKEVKKSKLELELVKLRLRQLQES